MAKIRCESHGKRVHIFSDLRKVIHRHDGTACDTKFVMAGDNRYTLMQLVVSSKSN